MPPPYHLSIVQLFGRIAIVGILIWLSCVCETLIILLLLDMLSELFSLLRIMFIRIINSSFRRNYGRDEMIKCGDKELIYQWHMCIWCRGPWEIICWQIYFERWFQESQMVSSTESVAIRSWRIKLSKVRRVLYGITVIKGRVTRKFLHCSFCTNV